MTPQAAIGLRTSMAVHVGLILAGLAWTTSYEVPHFHMLRGSVTLEASFAAVEPVSFASPAILSAADVIDRPVEVAERDFGAAKLLIQRAPEPLEARVVRSELPKLPAELEECCEAPVHQIQTPKRSVSQLRSPAEFTEVSPSKQRTPVAGDLAVATAVLVPSTSLAPGSEVDELPKKLASNRPPSYPAEAYRRGQQGRVLLSVRVSAEGSVEGVEIAKSSGVASLDQAALEAVRTWRFEPARRGGVPVPATVNVPVRFAIRS